MNVVPPGYFAMCDRLLVIVRDVVREHGAPAFLMPPEGVIVPAPVDGIGGALADNDAARAIVARTKDQDFTILMLLAILETERIPYTRAESIRGFVDRIERRTGTRFAIAIVGTGITDKGDRDLLAAAKKRTH